MNGAGSFWERRRAAVQAEAEAEAREAEAREIAARAAERAERADAEVLAEMNLPDPASMQAGDDFSAFMSRDVPEHLRRQALRTLWRSNPVLACLDGLNDYDEDYRAAAAMQGPVKTAYQVGKGLTRHIEELARQARASEAETEPATGMQAAEREAPAEPAVAPQEPVAEPVAAQKNDAPEAELAPRRMRFRFEEARA
jgi:hypothetical protein